LALAAGGFAVSIMPSLSDSSYSFRSIAGLAYVAVFFASPTFVKYKPARDQRDDPARQVPQAATLTMAKRPRASDETLVELFLDMQAAERGAGENTLGAIVTIWPTWSRFCARKVSASRCRAPTICADS